MWNLQNQSKHETGSRFYNTLWFPMHQWDSGNARLTKAATTTTMSLPRICFFPLSGFGELKKLDSAPGRDWCTQKVLFSWWVQAFLSIWHVFFFRPPSEGPPDLNITGDAPTIKFLISSQGDCAIARTWKLSSAIASLKSALQTPSSLEH